MGLHFTAKVQEFTRELSLALAAVEKKTTIPILGNVLLSTGDGLGRLSIAATDLELAIITGVSASIHTAGAITIPAKKLLDYTKLLPPTADLTVKVGDTLWASLSSGKSKCRIAGMSTESYPELPDTPAGSPITVQASELIRVIRQTAYAISAEESRFTLNGALFEFGGNQGRMVATDSHRLALAVFPVVGSTPAKMLVPRKAMGEAAKFAATIPAEATVSIFHDDNHIFMEFGGRRIVSRRMTGNFPDYTRVLPDVESFKGGVIVKRVELSDALNRVKGFADERSRAVKFRFERDGLSLFAQTSDMGDSEDVVAIVEQRGNTAEIGFNANYVHDYTGTRDAENVEFLFRDQGAACVMRDAGDKSGAVYVLMPMRI